VTADASRTPVRTLIAGVGDVFLGDDGFGVEAVRRLAEQPLPDGVEIADAGVRGVDLAHRMLRGYHTVLLVDACARGGEPGTVHVLDAAAPVPVRPRDGTPDGDHLTPEAVLALLDTLSGGTGEGCPQRVLVVGCEPAEVGGGVGLSAPVAAAVDEAVGLILRLVGAGQRAPEAAGPDAETARPQAAAAEEHPASPPAAPDEAATGPGPAPREVPAATPVPNEAAVAAPGSAAR
jgi:hydrogenase maturation protease